MQLTMRDALEMLANIVKHGDEGMVQDNAHDMSPIWCVIDSIDPSEDYETDLTVNGNGIYAIDIHGYLDRSPIFRVMG